MLALGVLAVAAMTAGPALAERGGNGGGRGHGGQATGTATLAIDPASPVHGTYFNISGCGYTAGLVVKVEIVFPDGGGAATGTAVDAAGCISLNWGVDTAGDHVLNTYQDLGGKRWTWLATLPFTAQ